MNRVILLCHNLRGWKLPPLIFFNFRKIYNSHPKNGDKMNYCIIYLLIIKIEAGFSSVGSAEHIVKWNGLATLGARKNPKKWLESFSGSFTLKMAKPLNCRILLREFMCANASLSAWWINLLLWVLLLPLDFPQWVCWCDCKLSPSHAYWQQGSFSCDRRPLVCKIRTSDGQHCSPTINITFHHCLLRKISFGLLDKGLILKWRSGTR